MFSVIFEVHPKQEKFGLYLELAENIETDPGRNRRFHRQ